MNEKDLAHAIVDFANSLEAACVQLKRSLSKSSDVGIRENPFLGLKWEEREGDKLRAFDIATKEANPEDSFRRCYSILKVNGATINKRFYDRNWDYAYWLFSKMPDVIYRQRLKSEK